MKILFLCIYPEDQAPSQRFRFEQFFPYFKEKGVSYDVDCFYSDGTYQVLQREGNALWKAVLILMAYLKRFSRLLKFRNYDFIFIQREAAPIGPPMFEYVIAKVFGGKIIYDFDDSIWMPQDGKGGRLFRWVKSYNKVGRICKWAYHVTAGNAFLADYAKQFTKQVTVVPTVVDTNSRYAATKAMQATSEVVIGWTGSYSTLRYLASIKEALLKVNKQVNMKLLVIADKQPEEIEGINMEFIPWNEKQEIADLLKMDIGIMPLIDNAWTRGKCGFKAIQYMALGIPALVSDVGVNPEIVEHGVNGFVCRSEEDWAVNAANLAKDHTLRTKMGIAAKSKIEKHYSINYAFPLMYNVISAVR